MAELALNPVELPPGRVEELDLPTDQPQGKLAPEANGTPTAAQPVSGAELLDDRAKPVTEPVKETPKESGEPVSPFEGKRGKHPKDCFCTTCKRSRKIKELIDGEPPKANPSQSHIPPADFSDVHVPPGVSTQTQPGGASPETRPDYLAMAKVTFSMSEGLLCTVFGPEWKRDNDEEMMSVCIPLSVCLEKWGMSDLPPGYVLCFVCLAYAGKRMNKPTTKDKIARAWLWLKSKFRRKQKPMSVNVEQKEQNV